MLLIVSKVKWDVGLFGPPGRGGGFEIDLLYAVQHHRIARDQTAAYDALMEHERSNVGDRVPEHLPLGVGHVRAAAAYGSTD